MTSLTDFAEKRYQQHDQLIISKAVFSSLIISILATLLTTLSSISLAENARPQRQVIEKDKLLQLVNDNKDYQQVIHLSSSIKLNAHYSASSKGNATIRIKNL